MEDRKTVYLPSAQDVFSVKRSLRGLQLPLELIDTIIDHAEYWPHSTTIQSGAEIATRAGSENENRFMLRSYPLGFVPGQDGQADYQMVEEYEKPFTTLQPQPWGDGQKVHSSATEEVLKAWSTTTRPRTERPCRKIVFTLVSRDQGWGGERIKGRPYDGSFTWFDVGKEELSAFKEETILEAWNSAPWPQFRLYDSKNSNGRGQIQNKTSKETSHLVCSMRTVLPLSIPKGGNANDNNDIEGEDQNNFQAPQDHGASSKPEYQFKHDFCPTDDVLQKNVVAEHNINTHTITWSFDDNIQPESPEGDEFDFQGRGRNTGQGDFIRNMKLGDCVTVWAKARFRGWVNNVRTVKIDVYWAV